jgi:hypothetical protein
MWLRCVLINDFIIMIKVLQNDSNLSSLKRSFGLSSDATAITHFSRAHFIRNFEKSIKESWRSRIIPPFLDCLSTLFPFTAWFIHASIHEVKAEERNGRNYMIHREIIRYVRGSECSASSNYNMFVLSGRHLLSSQWCWQTIIYIPSIPRT